MCKPFPLYMCTCTQYYPVYTYVDLHVLLASKISLIKCMESIICIMKLRVNHVAFFKDFLHVYRVNNNYCCLHVHAY